METRAIKTAKDVMGECMRRRIRLRAFGSEIKAWPRTLLTGDLRDAIEAHKAELVALVKLEQCHVVIARLEAMVWAAQNDGHEILPVQSVKAVLKELYQ